MMSRPDAVKMDVIVLRMNEMGQKESGQIEMEAESLDDVYASLEEEYNFTIENIDLFYGKNCQLMKTWDSCPLSPFSEDGKKVVLFMSETEEHLGLPSERDFKVPMNTRTVIYGKEEKFKAFVIKEGTKKLDIKPKKIWFVNRYQTFGLLTEKKTEQGGEEYEFLEFKACKEGVIQIDTKEENNGYFDKDKDTVKLLTQTGAELLEPGVSKKFRDCDLTTVDQRATRRLEKAKLLVKGVTGLVGSVGGCIAAAMGAGEIPEIVRAIEGGTQ